LIRRKSCLRLTFQRRQHQANPVLSSRGQTGRFGSPILRATSCASAPLP